MWSSGYDLVWRREAGNGSVLEHVVVMGEREFRAYHDRTCIDLGSFR